MTDEMKRELSQLRTETKTGFDSLRAMTTELKSSFDSFRGEMQAEIAKLHATDARIAASAVRLEGRMDKLEATVATKDDISRVISHIVSFSRDVEAAQRDRISSSNAYMSHQRQLEDHEARLSRLEGRKD